MCLLQWPLLICPLMAAIQAGLALMLQKIGSGNDTMRQNKNSQEEIHPGVTGRVTETGCSNPCFTWQADC